MIVEGDVVVRCALSHITLSPTRTCQASGTVYYQSFSDRGLFTEPSMGSLRPVDDARGLWLQRSHGQVRGTIASLRQSLEVICVYYGIAEGFLYSRRFEPREVMKNAMSRSRATFGITSQPCVQRVLSGARLIVLCQGTSKAIFQEVLIPH